MSEQPGPCGATTQTDVAGLLACHKHSGHAGAHEAFGSIDSAAFFHAWMDKTEEVPEPEVKIASPSAGDDMTSALTLEQALAMLPADPDDLDQYLAERLQDPEFAAAYEQARRSHDWVEDESLTYEQKMALFQSLEPVEIREPEGA
jgi:hypothetical protein